MGNSQAVLRHTAGGCGPRPARSPARPAWPARHTPPAPPCPAWSLPSWRLHTCPGPAQRVWVWGARWWRVGWVRGVLLRQTCIPCKRLPCAAQCTPVRDAQLQRHASCSSPPSPPQAAARPSPRPPPARSRRGLAWTRGGSPAVPAPACPTAGGLSARARLGWTCLTHLRLRRRRACGVGGVGHMPGGVQQAVGGQAGAPQVQSPPSLMSRCRRPPGLAAHRLRVPAAQLRGLHVAAAGAFASAAAAQTPSELERGAVAPGRELAHPAAGAPCALLRPLRPAGFCS